MSTLRKDPVTNQDKTIMGINKNKCLTPDVTPFLPGNKVLLNERNDDNPETKDTPKYQIYYMSHTRRDAFIAKVKDTKNTNNYDE